MTSSQGNALVQSYHEVCKELNTEPVPEFLACLESGSKICRLSSVQQEEQLYSTVSLLPYLELEELDVSGLQLDANCWASLAEGAAKCKGLQVLSLKGCGLGKLGPAALNTIATHIGSSSVAVLDLSQNSLGDGFLLPLCSTPLLTQGQHLSVLDVSENAITCSGAALLAATLEACGGECCLRQLDVSFNRLGDEGAAALAGLVGSTPLVALELEGNQVTDVGGLAIAAVLGGAGAGPSRLQRLNLNSNLLSAETQRALADALRDTSNPLQELAVAGCSGGDSGAASLFAALRGNDQLQLLDVRGVPVGPEAARHLCAALADPSCALVTLRMDVATKEAAEAVAQALPGNTHLLQLMMGGPVPEHVLSFIGATISSNALHRLAAANEAAAATASARKSKGGTVHWDASSTPTASAEFGPGAAAASPGVSSSQGLRGSSGQARERSVSPGQDLGSSWQRSPPGGRPGSAGTGARRTLDRSLTVRAKQLALLDPTGLAGLSGGGSAHKAAEVFKRHDSDASGYLDAEEMMAALQDLGMLDGMKAKALGKFLSNAIKEADTDQDGRVSLPEFIRYYERLARHYADAARQGRIQARSRLPLVPLDAVSDPGLKKAFKAYCRVPIGVGRQVGASVQHLNAAQFNLLARDVGLVEPAGPLSQCAVDIIFTRCKPAGSRRLTFKEFLEAFGMVCEEAGMDFSEMASTMTRTATAPGTPSGARGSGGFDHPAMFDQEPVQLVQLPPSAARRGSLTDNKVGPYLPHMSASVGTGGSGSILSKLRFTPPRGVERPASPTFVHRAASPTASAARRNSNPASSSPPGDGGSMGRRELSSKEAVRASYPPTSDRSNPLFEVDSGSAGAAGDDTAKQLAARLAAVEEQLAGRGPRSGSIKAAADLPAALQARLTVLEEQAASRQAQMEVLTSQQGELQRLVLRLADGLDALRGQAAAADVAALKQQVADLSTQVERVDKRAQEAAAAGGSSPGPELIALVERKLGARQSRMEDALMQVARQVDVLDMRLKEEQESSLKALEAILAGASPAK